MDLLNQDLDFVRKRYHLMFLRCLLNSRNKPCKIIGNHLKKYGIPVHDGGNKAKGGKGKAKGNQRSGKEEEEEEKEKRKKGAEARLGQSAVAMRIK